MGDLFKQKLAIVVAFGICSLLIFFVSIGIYSNIINNQLNNYSKQSAEYINTIMDLAVTRNKMVLDYAISDSYFNDTYDNILAKQKQDGYITSLCKEVKSLVSYAQSILVVMENGEVYASDDTFNSYIEQFKNIKNSEFYKDTCRANSFAINRYNKYYNVECYSYSNSIYDKNGRKVGTMVVTYPLTWVWNDINSLDKDDFVGTVIYETFDKQILCIIDENGVERYSDNELIGDRANELLSKRLVNHVNNDYDRMLRIYFLANEEVLVSRFDSVRTVCITAVLIVLLIVIVLTLKRKDKFLLEIIIIAISAVVVFAALWVSFRVTYFDIASKTIKITRYCDKEEQKQLESSFKRGMEAYSDYLQSTLLKNVSNQLTAKEFNDSFSNLVIENGLNEHKKIKKMFMFGKPVYIYLDENRKIDFDKGIIAYLNKAEKEVYTKISKSGSNEYYEIEQDKLNGHMIKKMYYKNRILSKYTLIFAVSYDVTNFYETNTNNKLNIIQIGETYYINYGTSDDDKYRVELIRSNELSKLEGNHDDKSVEVSCDIFGGKIKEMIKQGTDYNVITATSSNGNSNKLICFNNKDAKRIEAFFLKESIILKSNRIILYTELVEIGLFLTLLLYNYLEIRRMKRKEKKEEIVLHGNF